MLAACGGGGGGSGSDGGATSSSASSIGNDPVPNPSPAPSVRSTGLQFPGDNYVNRRFRRALPAASIPDPYPLTVIFQAYPQDNGVAYQTFFFHGIEGDFSPNSLNYYGAAPYPFEGREMRWEVGAYGRDDTIEGDIMTYDRWFNCAFIAWSDGAGKHIRFYHDLPDTRRVISVDVDGSYFNTLTPTHSFTWGDAPWQHVTDGNKEQFKGILRRLKIFTTNLSVADAMREAQSDAIETERGAGNLWYLNANPRPDDLSDHSGNGHHFSWFDPNFTASLWTA